MGAYLTPGIHDYRTADDHLRVKGRDTVTLGHNTTLIRRAPDTIAVRYHHTDIITYHQDGRTTLDTGGWITTTTAHRFNELTRYHVSGRYPRTRPDVVPCHEVRVAPFFSDPVAVLTTTNPSVTLD